MIRTWKLKNIIQMVQLSLLAQDKRWRRHLTYRDSSKIIGLYEEDV